MTASAPARRSASRSSADRSGVDDRAGGESGPIHALGSGILVGLLAAAVTPGGDAEVRSFFEVSPTAQLLLSADRKIRVANQAAGRLFAPTGAAINGRPFTDLLAPAARPTIERLFQALTDPAVAGQRVASEAIAPDGHPFPIELLVVRLSAGVPSGFGIVARDLRAPAPGRQPTPIEAGGSYTLAELLMANRLRELV